MASSAAVFAGTHARAALKLLVLAVLAAFGCAEAFVQQTAARGARIHLCRTSTRPADGAAAPERDVAGMLYPQAPAAPERAAAQPRRAAAAAACLGLLVAFAAPREAGARLGGAAMKKALALSKAARAAKATRTKALVLSNMISESKKACNAKAEDKKEESVEAKGCHA